MAYVSKTVNLTDEWQKIIDNAGSNDSFYVNKGAGEFAYSDSDNAPDIETGMVISAGARIIKVPQNSTLYGRLLNYTKNKDRCVVIKNIDE